MTPIERAARALCEIDGIDPDQKYRGDHSVGHEPFDYHWRCYQPRARAVIAAIREPISDASVYLKADAEAWESGAKGAAHETYLLHCGRLRRDIAAQIDALLEEAQ